ncbi:pro-neuregulin-4, membrane-bound isoform, partial [Sturnira hondurensis]|uniref:pro-neuregulin-4, membrane-bound isoform n=1 Tax=Sturnira hondurensis TaxID=192404 RepID=UPI00187911C6
HICLCFPSIRVSHHEEPLSPGHRSFGLNGGICYTVPAVPSPLCGCVDNYMGAHREEVFLPSASTQTKPGLQLVWLRRFSQELLAWSPLPPLQVVVEEKMNLQTVGLNFSLHFCTYPISILFTVRKGHLQKANAVQQEVSLAETTCLTWTNLSHPCLPLSFTFCLHP